MHDVVLHMPWIELEADKARPEAYDVEHRDFSVWSFLVWSLV